MCLVGQLAGYVMMSVVVCAGGQGGRLGGLCSSRLQALHSGRAPHSCRQAWICAGTLSARSCSLSHSVQACCCSQSISACVQSTNQPTSSTASFSLALCFTPLEHTVPLFALCSSPLSLHLHSLLVCTLFKPSDPLSALCSPPTSLSLHFIQTHCRLV